MYYNISLCDARFGSLATLPQRDAIGAVGSGFVLDRTDKRRQDGSRQRHHTRRLGPRFSISAASDVLAMPS